MDARFALALVAGWVVTGCTTGSPSGPGDGGADSGLRIVDGCDTSRDADADGIADAAEGDGDSDGDGTPNDRDLDSDGDGVIDAEEHGDAHPCVVLDSDRDGTPDFADADSDNDGLTDADERGVYFTDPLERDSDGDDVTDLGEVAAGTDPRDPASTISPEDFFVVLPYFGDHEPRPLRFGTNIVKADVYFLIDTTGSMEAPIANVQSSLSRIAGELDRLIPDLEMGVGHFEDFPFSTGDPFGPTFFGAPDDQAYENLQDITGELADVQSALDGLTIGDGRDGPEGQVQALFQTASGRGGTWSFMGSSYTIPPRRCVAVPDEIGARRGYPCFRPGALPIVVLVTDLEWHAGSADGTRWPYTAISPAPQNLIDAAAALSAIGGRYIGVAIDGTWRTDHEAVASLTGSVDEAGMALVYGAAAGEVSDRIIDGVSTIVGRTPQDVTTQTEDVPPNPGGIDATRFIVSITPLEGYGPAAGTGYVSKDESTFYGVTPGTVVEFTVDFYNDFVMPPPTAQIYRARIVVVGNGVARLSERNVYIIVPPEGGIVLI